MTTLTPEERFEKHKTDNATRIKESWPSTQVSKRGLKWTPEERERQSKLMKARWADKEISSEMRKAQSAGWTTEARAKASERILKAGPTDAQMASRSKPTKTSTKLLMREAKLGIPKSKEHAAAMSASHRLRAKVLNCVKEELGCTYREASKIVKANREHYYAKYEGSLK